jgi:hypothetical protein
MLCSLGGTGGVRRGLGRVWATRVCPVAGILRGSEGHCATFTILVRRCRNKVFTMGT